MKHLFRRADYRQRQKRALSQTSKEYADNLLPRSSGSAQKKGANSNKALESLYVTPSRRKRHARQSHSYSQPTKPRKKGLLGKLTGKLGAKTLSLRTVSPQVRRRKHISAESLAFSGEKMSAPSQGALARKDRRMNKKARKGAYLNLTAHKRRKSRMSYTSLSFSGASSKHGKKKGAKLGLFRKGNKPAMAATRVKATGRPVADRTTGKRKERLPRLTKVSKPSLKYDKKERKIWAQ